MSRRITLHEVSNVVGFVPVLVMDVWEHERPRCIEAFFSSIAWDVVERRLMPSAPVSGAAAGERP